MSNLFALGSRPLHSPLFRTAHDGGTAGAQMAWASGKAAPALPVLDPVSLSAGSITLSQQALNARLDQLGDKTVEVAQRFIGNIAESLFGDAAKGATFRIDAISVSADTHLSAAVDTASGAATGVDAAALQLNASASFIGRGTIATSDGQSFNFEIEVQYAASIQAGTSATVAAQQPLKAPDTLALTGKPLPEIKFPGSLADLFKLLGRQLAVSTNSGKSDGGGDLSLRLLRLVNSAALLAPRARADSPEATPVERNRALASYASPAPSGTVITA